MGNQMKAVMEENMKKQFKFQEDIMTVQVCECLAIHMVAS